jgi:CBS domain containing-hemolysin-like protein
MMAIALTTIIIVGLLLVLVTLVQTFYLESLRLRTRDQPALQFFKDVLDDRLGFKAEQGALRFSLIKHSLLVLLGVAFLALSTADEGLTILTSLEAFALAWLTMLAVAYMAPQVLYRRTKGRWLLVFVPLLRLLALLVRPLTALLGFLESLARLAEPENGKEEAATPAENIEALITAGTEEGIIEEEDRRLIQSAAEFGTKTVREVMTPRPAIVAISADATLDDLRQLVINEQYSRIPVYEENIDNIIGFVHVRDMFELDEQERKTKKVRDLVRPIRFVPETKPVDDLLREMQQEGTHMAIVVDEYGNTAGLVTMEDMVEELVGEIRDEHEPGHDVKADDNGGYIVSGSFDVDHLHDLVSFRAEEDTESTTIGGLITEWAGHVPQPGEKVEKDGIRVEVLAGNELRVDQVRVSRVDEKSDAA